MNTRGRLYAGRLFAGRLFGPVPADVVPDIFPIYRAPRPAQRPRTTLRGTAALGVWVGVQARAVLRCGAGGGIAQHVAALGAARLVAGGRASVGVVQAAQASADVVDVILEALLLAD